MKSLQFCIFAFAIYVIPHNVGWSIVTEEMSLY